MKTQIGSLLRGPLGFVLAAAAFYLGVTAPGLLHEGYNSDDWRHLAGHYAPWSEVEGRWLMEILFRDVLGGQFHPMLQIALAFVCFLAIAALLAAEAAPSGQRWLYALLIFVIGVNMPYMADALNFNAHVFAYPLALLISLGGFLLLQRNAERPLRLFLLAVPLAALALSLSYSIYQPFAIFGALVPALALVRWDRDPLGRVATLFAACALAGGLALVLNKAEWHGYMALQGREIAGSRFGALPAESALPLVRRMATSVISIQNGVLMALPRPLRMVLAAFAGAAFLWPILATALCLRKLTLGAGALALLRAGTGAFLIVAVFPMLFTLQASQSEMPPRAVAFLGFWLAALIAAGAAMLPGDGPAALPRRMLQTGGLAVLGIAGLSGLVVSHAIWSDRARMSAQEAQLAHDIYDSVIALPGYDRQDIRLVGDRAFPFRWGGAMSVSVYHGNNTDMSILQQSFGLAAPESALTASPRDCPAFPEPGSAFLGDDGYAYVCLSPRQALLPLSDCQPTTSAEIGTICRKGEYLVRQWSGCGGPMDKSRRVVAELPAGGTQIKLDAGYIPFTLGGTCVQVVSIKRPLPLPDEIAVGIQLPDRSVVDREVLRFPPAVSN